MFNTDVIPYNDPLPWWEEEHAAYSFSYVPVKTRLELINGSGVIKLTDRRFMIQFMRNIQTYHELQQQKRIEERKNAETLRWFGRIV